MFVKVLCLGIILNFSLVVHTFFYLFPFPLFQSCATVQSISENTTTPISLLEVAPPSGSTQPCLQPSTQASAGPGLCVSAQVEPCASSFGALGSLIGGLQGESDGPLPREKRTHEGTGEKPELLPGSIVHM